MYAFSFSLIDVNVQLCISQLTPHTFLPNDLLFGAGIASRLSATGVVTVVNHNNNSFLLNVSQDDGPDDIPLVVRGEMFEQPLPPINHIVVLRGNVLSIRWAEAFVAVQNLTVL